MIAVDTNVLVFAYRADSPHHGRARSRVEDLARQARDWAIPWPCVHEFLAVVTHPKIFRTPTPLREALAEVRRWAAQPNLHLLAERDGYLERLAAVTGGAGIRGGMVHDARIAAICLVHAVETLWSNDRDFSRFPMLKVVDPLAA